MKLDEELLQVFKRYEEEKGVKVQSFQLYKWYDCNTKDFEWRFSISETLDINIRDKRINGTNA